MDFDPETGENFAPFDILVRQDGFEDQGRASAEFMR